MIKMCIEQNTMAFVSQEDEQKWELWHHEIMFIRYSKHEEGELLQTWIRSILNLYAVQTEVI